MTVRPGEEFRNIATPSQELLRRLAYLATQDSESVLTGGIRSIRDAFRSADSRHATASAEFLLQLTRLADPAYQAMSTRINEKLDRMDEASVIALQDIERELLKLRREREKMLEQAYRDEQGRPIFMTDDGSAAYYEDGARVEDDTFGQIKDRLRGKPTWEQFQEFERREAELAADRGVIHEHDAERERLRDDLAAGRITKEEAERREREIEEAMPERLRANYKPATTDAGPNTALSAEEEAALNIRGAPAPGDPQHPAPPGPGASPAP